MKEINFVTSNQEKIKEARQIISNIKINQKKIDYPEIQAEIERVAEKGAIWCYEKIKKPLFVEDSGLFIDELNGFPGPFSSYIHEKLGNNRILKLMKNEENRKASFISIIAYKDKKNIKLFKGEVKGEITLKIRGKKGFGYDPVFKPKSTQVSFGEMERKEKNKYSHRKKALKKLTKFLHKNI